MKQKKKKMLNMPGKTVFVLVHVFSTLNNRINPHWYPGSSILPAGTIFNKQEDKMRQFLVRFDNEKRKAVLVDQPGCGLAFLEEEEAIKNSDFSWVEEIEEL